MSKKEVYSNMRYSETVHQEAYQLFLQGYACRQISETCHVPLPTIYLWQRRWREKLSGQTLKDLSLEDAGTLLLTTQALRRELEEAQRDLQILHESGILRTIPIRDRSLFARKYADQVPYIYKVFELSPSAFFRYRKESAVPPLSEPNNKRCTGKRYSASFWKAAGGSARSRSARNCGEKASAWAKSASGR